MGKRKPVKRKRTRYGHSNVWARATRKAQGLKPLTEAQRNLTPDQRKFLANLYGFRGASSKYVTVYGYGSGRGISHKVVDPLVRRGLIKARNWKQQRYDKKSKQVDLKLTKKGSKFGKQFHW